MSVITVVTIIQHNQRRRALTQDAIDMSMQETHRVDSILDLELGRIMGLADGIADGLSLQKIGMDTLPYMLNAALQSYEDVFGTGIILDVDSMVQGKPRRGMFRYKDGKDIIVEDSAYSLRVPDFKWYENRKNKGGWSDNVFISGISEEPTVQYSKAITAPGQPGNKIGLVYIQLSIRGIASMMNTLSLGKAGYGFILGSNDNFIYHPNDQWVWDQVSIYESGYFDNREMLEQAIAAVKSGDTKLLNFRNPVNGQESWYFFEPMDNSDWLLGVMFFKEELLNEHIKARHTLIFITILTVIGIGFLLLSLPSTRNYNWSKSYLMSIFFVLGIAYIWYLGLEQPILKGWDVDREDVIITDKVVLEAFKTKMDSSLYATERENYSFIPTGIFLEHIQLMESHTFMVSGYVWQKYTDGLHDHIARGFLFPEAEPNAEYIEIEEAYNHREGNQTVYGWYFRVSLRKKFNYGLFPLDWQNIRIKLWHIEFLDEVFLVPDLDANQYNNPTSLPGLQRNFVMPGWTLEQSFFNYKKNRYNSDFGVRSAKTNRDIMELNFNVYAKRVFWSPFVTNFFPIFVVVMLLFIAVLNNQKQADERVMGRWGILELGAAFFFVLIIGQTNLRSQLNVEELIYVEYYYFAVYVAIIITCIVSTAVFKTNIKALTTLKKDDLMKYAYWPMITGFLFLVTCLVFY